MRFLSILAAGTSRLLIPSSLAAATDQNGTLRLNDDSGGSRVRRPYLCCPRGGYLGLCLHSGVVSSLLFSHRPRSRLCQFSVRFGLRHGSLVHFLRRSVPVAFTVLRPAGVGLATK
jgi:hypothetical protein